MPRELRPRKSQPSYSAALHDLEDDDVEAGPSITIYESADSESDFAPDKGVPEEEEEDEEEDAPGEDEDEIDEDDENEEVAKRKKGKKQTTMRVVESASSRRTTKPKKDAGSRAGSAILAPGVNLPRTSRRQMHMLPTPSVHHRHRATPLFSRPGLVERLVSRPELFGPVKTTLTNSFTHNSQITDRVNKAWGYNVGSGPLWQMVEDRRWFKEAVTTGKDVDAERCRRPRVYQNVRVRSGWTILDKR